MTGVSTVLGRMEDKCTGMDKRQSVHEIKRAKVIYQAEKPSESQSTDRCGSFHSLPGQSYINSPKNRKRGDPLRMLDGFCLGLSRDWRLSSFKP